MIIFLTCRPRECAYKKFGKEDGMGVWEKGRGRTLHKGFSPSLPPAAGGKKRIGPCQRELAWADKYLSTVPI